MIGAHGPYQERVRERQESMDHADSQPDAPDRTPTDWLHPRCLFEDEASFHAELHYNIAGQVAHQMRYGFSEGCGGDRRRFHSLISLFYGNLAGFVSGSTIALLRARYWNSCREILSRRDIWAWTRRVAAAAVRSEHGVLTGDQIDQLGPCWPGPPASPAAACRSRLATEMTGNCRTGGEDMARAA